MTTERADEHPIPTSFATPGTPGVAGSARLVGQVQMGFDAVVAQGTVVRSVGGAVHVGHDSAVLENSTVVDRPGHETSIGRRTVFGHRCVVAGATVGDLCEIGNGSLLLPGAVLGDHCVLGEGTLVPTVVVFDSAEITGDVHVGARTIIGAGVRIIGDSHGPVRIGADVQILENTVLHLLPDNELVLEDGVIIGPACMIHGCHLGAGTVVEPGANVCDWSEVGAGSVVRAGSLIPQRASHPGGVVLEGFPAKVLDGVEPDRSRPSWAFAEGDLDTLRPV